MMIGRKKTMPSKDVLLSNRTIAGLNWFYSRFVVQVNSFASDVLPIYGIAVIRQVDSRVSRFDFTLTKPGHPAGPCEVLFLVAGHSLRLGELLFLFRCELRPV